MCILSQQFVFLYPHQYWRYMFQIILLVRFRTASEAAVQTLHLCVLMHCGCCWFPTLVQYLFLFPWSVLNSKKTKYSGKFLFYIFRWSSLSQGLSAQLGQTWHLLHSHGLASNTQQSLCVSLSTHVLELHVCGTMFGLGINFQINC